MPAFLVSQMPLRTRVIRFHVVIVARLQSQDMTDERRNEAQLNKEESVSVNIYYYPDFNSWVLQEDLDSLGFWSPTGMDIKLSNTLIQHAYRRINPDTSFYIPTWSQLSKEADTLSVPFSLYFDPDTSSLSLVPVGQFAIDDFFPEKKTFEMYREDIASYLSSINALNMFPFLGKDSLPYTDYNDVKEIAILTEDDVSHLEAPIDFEFHINCTHVKKPPFCPAFLAYTVSHSLIVDFSLFQEYSDALNIGSEEFVFGISLKKTKSLENVNIGTSSPLLFLKKRSNILTYSFMKFDIPRTSDDLFLPIQLKDKASSFYLETFFRQVLSLIPQLKDKGKVIMLLMWFSFNQKELAEAFLKKQLVGLKKSKRISFLIAWTNIAEKYDLHTGLSDEIVTKFIDVKDFLEHTSFLSTYVSRNDIVRSYFVQHGLSFPIWESIKKLQSFLTFLDQIYDDPSLSEEKDKLIHILLQRSIKSLDPLLQSLLPSTLLAVKDMLPSSIYYESLYKVLQQEFFNSHPPIFSDIDKSIELKSWLKWCNFFDNYNIILKFCKSLPLQFSDGWLFNPPELFSEFSSSLLKLSSFPQVWIHVVTYWSEQIEAVNPLTSNIFSDNFRSEVLRFWNNNWLNFISHVDLLIESFVGQLILLYPSANKTTDAVKLINFFEKMKLGSNLPLFSLLDHIDLSLLKTDEIEEYTRTHLDMSSNDYDYYLHERMIKEEGYMPLEESEYFLSSQTYLTSIKDKQESLGLIIDGDSVLKDQRNAKDRKKKLSVLRLLILLRQLKSYDPRFQALILFTAKGKRELERNEYYTLLESNFTILTLDDNSYSRMAEIAKQSHFFLLSNRYFKSESAQLKRNDQDWLHFYQVKFIWDKLSKVFVIPLFDYSLGFSLF